MAWSWTVDGPTPPSSAMASDAERVEADVRGWFYISFDLLPDVTASLMAGAGEPDAPGSSTTRRSPCKPTTQTRGDMSLSIPVHSTPRPELDDLIQVT
ncbi:hypothetical protein MCOR34_007011 [Pyricularia oryzae]|nr:hypothetical protein MCOR34_007011 [Pyricularia oryzae]